MESLYLIAGLFSGAFIYALGIKHGKMFSENKEVLKSPVKTFTQYRNNKKTEEDNKQEFTEMQNLMSYTGDKQEV